MVGLIIISLYANVALAETCLENFNAESCSSQDGIIKLGAFNLQVFGPTKASNPEVMNVISKIIRNYDVIAVQEIRDASQTALPALNNTVNSIGSPQYNYVVSERLGRTTSKEQYAYFYNTQKIGLIGNPYVFNDSQDLFEREPFVANFKAINGSLDFVSITIHVKPENATEEINNLTLVIDDAKGRYQNEDDFIVMGDLNADCDYFDENSQSPLKSSDYIWIINNSIDTTTKATTCTYDRIIITTSAQNDFTGDSGVFRFDTAFNLTYENTTAVSDHYPVYADFLSDVNIIVTNPSASHEIPEDTDNEPLWGETAQLNVTVTDDIGIAGVTVDLSEIGRSKTEPMIHMGENSWSATTNVSAGTQPGIYYLRVNATNLYGISNTSVTIALKAMKNGDTTGNGVVNIGDALRLANNVSFPGNPVYALSSSYATDVTGNGILNIGDALRLANNVSFPGNALYILK